jgi:hypothetical protein
MDYTIKTDSLKLSSWYYAVLASKAVLQQKITELEGNGFVDPAFYIDKLEDLEDLEMFLKMSWDEWLASLAVDQTAVEESK